jgi:hypothetical protein
MKKNMKLLTSLCLLATLGLVGCGDGLSDNNYHGESLATIGGNLNIAPTDRPNDSIQIALIWEVEGAVDCRVDQELDIQSDNLGHYYLDVMTPPPDSALIVDQETGGRIGGAHIFAYDDPKNEGPIDLLKLKPEEYHTLMYRWRGGSEDKMLVYAKDSFPEDSAVAHVLGQAIEPGFYLVGFLGDCYYYFPEGNAMDSEGNPCQQPNTFELLPLDTPVDLNIVNDISDFRYAVPSLIRAR